MKIRKSEIRSPKSEVRKFLPTLLCALVLPLAASLAGEVPVFVPPDASSAERLAAEDLANFLGRIYPADRFALAKVLPQSGQGIVIGCATNSAVRPLLNQALPAAPESFLVTSRKQGPRELGIIAGSDARGVAYGVYALLEKLGCGFYLSYDALPPVKPEPFSFSGWQLADKPLARDRLVFDWHNFLSGCSTWNLPDWQSWIRQSQKMRYNAVMVHAYGNNPMVSFSFNGRSKPVGYLSTTVKGRDWSTMHVNDVRRLWGGEVFNQPAFGAEAALVPEDRRAGAAQQLMRDVFAYARQRAMDVYFANDIDTLTANPQELIQTLPLEARFAAGTNWLVNPDTPEGYRFYKAQVEALLSAYPQLTWLVLWFRVGHTPWTELKTAEMPAIWQREYQAEIAKTPEAEKLWRAPQVFAMGKIVRACDRALRELGHGRVQLAAGTWRFDFLGACDRFFPPHIKLIGLDYDVLDDRAQLRDETSRKVLRDVGRRRAVLPVIWAHHDDGNYLGRPYTPFAEFAAKLDDANACGFGIIHWTTRPLDLFFASHARQVWAGSQNEPLSATCRDMAAKSFGASTRDKLGQYLERWVTDAPKFARETGNLFMDRPLTNLDEVITGCRQRLGIISAAERSGLTPEQRDRVKYFQGLEEFIVAIHQTQGALQRSQRLLKAGDLAGARAAVAECQPEDVINKYARFSSLGGITRGEQGMVVALNLHWLTHFIQQRQALALEPVRYHFAPTSHEKLAQTPGVFTYHFDAGHRLWQTLGVRETGARTFVLPPETKVIPGEGLPGGYTELCRAGIESGQPLRLTLAPIMGKAALSKGDYRLRLLMLDPASTAPGQRVFTLAINTETPASKRASSVPANPAPTNPASVNDRVDIFQATGRANQVLERTYPVAVGPSGTVIVQLTPLQGTALLCAAILEPTEAPHQ